MNVVVCVPLTFDPVPAIAGTGPGLRVHYPVDLLPAQRFPADHKGAATRARSAHDEARWRELLAQAEVALGFPGDSPDGLRELVALAPRLRWVQGTAAGAGEQLAAAGLDARALARITVTSAAGIHAVPLAEFAVFGILALFKDIDVLQRLDAARRWPLRWPMRLLSGAHVVVVGLGGVGQEVARLCAAFGANVTGIRRQAGAATEPRTQSTPASPQVRGLADLDAVLPSADAVVLTLPGTERTRGLFDAARLARLPRHAVLVNVGRGSVVRTDDLVTSLDSGTIRGAVLDVTEIEPLPEASPLWGRPNVIISPHTAALTVTEDERIVGLFTENLARHIDGRPLRNVINLAEGY